MHDCRQKFQPLSPDLPLANETKRIPVCALYTHTHTHTHTHGCECMNARTRPIMHAHVRYSRVLHYRQGPKLRGRTYTLGTRYLPWCTVPGTLVRTQVRGGSPRCLCASGATGSRRRARPKLSESVRTAGSRLSRSSPDATSSQYRVSPLAELVSDLCESRASRHSPFLHRRSVPFCPRPGSIHVPLSHRPGDQSRDSSSSTRHAHPPFRNTSHASYVYV